MSKNIHCGFEKRTINKTEVVNPVLKLRTINKTCLSSALMYYYYSSIIKAQYYRSSETYSIKTIFKKIYIKKTCTDEAFCSCVKIRQSNYCMNWKR